MKSTIKRKEVVQDLKLSTSAAIVASAFNMQVCWSFTLEHTWMIKDTIVRFARNPLHDPTIANNTWIMCMLVKLSMVCYESQRLNKNAKFAIKFSITAAICGSIWFCIPANDRLPVKFPTVAKHLVRFFLEYVNFFEILEIINGHTRFSFTLCFFFVYF